MIHYYLIRPTPALLTVLQNYSESFAGMKESYIWESDEHPHSINEGEFMSMIAKLAFLCKRMPAIIPPETEVQVSKIYLEIGVSLEQQKETKAEKIKLWSELFGDPPQWNIATFDRWWTIERIGPGGNVQRTFELASAEELAMLEKTNDPAIDHWLETMIIHRRKQESST